ncbi:MAG: lipid-A-disaccharide synthase [Gammaproteobacteria bacterium]|nr:MAG: lipid-A-disaccharide synthase [Gammaproteobacteria bacterium]
MHIALFAGEPSGDQLGAELIKALRKLNPCIFFDGVGGPLMQAEGFNSLLPMEDFAVMGISEIVGSLPRLLNCRKKLTHYYQSVMPDAFVGIDYPEFNLSLEQRLKTSGIFTVHYVSPSVWAWREKRIHHIKNACDLMLTLFAFEKGVYDQHQMRAVHCGHPLLDIIPETIDTPAARQQLKLSDNAHYLAILPGSRPSEVKRMLPIFIQTAKKLYRRQPALHCLIPAANDSLFQLIGTVMEKKARNLPYTVFFQQAKTVMTAADAVLLTSGTSTLEAMLLQKPMLVSYKVSPITAILARQMLNISHFSLPNLLADHPIVPEFMQEYINTSEMAEILETLIVPSNDRARMVEYLIETRKKLKKNGAENAAKAIYDHLTYQQISLS